MSSRGWLGLFVVSLITVGILAAFKYSDRSSVRGVTYGVDLDQTLDTFKESGGAKDLKQFETAFNAKGIYPGGYVTVAWAQGNRPSILGFVDNNANGVFDQGTDTFVFRLQMEHPSDNEYRLIASDGVYYRYHPIVGSLATWYLAGSIVDLLWARHYGLYGFGPRLVYTYSYAPRGYYRAPRYSRGSWGGRSSGGRFGGK
jgi:hypothetical protein